jgi:TPR repeat protein
LKMAQEELSLHTCASNAPTSVRISTAQGLAWGDYRACLQLFTCLLDGFGVDPNTDKALDCLVSGAERGKSNSQYDLALFSSF